MIDFIKLLYCHFNIDLFLDRNKAKLKAVFNFDTGSISYPFTFSAGEYTVTIREGKSQNYHYIEITGSLHKNFFSGANFERFNYIQLKEEIQNLCSQLDLEAEKLFIQNLEVGVNIITPFEPFTYLNDNLILYSTKQFKQYHKGKDGKELGYYCEGTPTVKIYDKGKQYNLNYNLMRFEIRYKKSKILKSLGINTLSDLIRVESLCNLGVELQKTWSNVLLYESGLPLKELKKCARKFYIESEHGKNWLKYLRDYKSRTTFYKRKTKFKKLIKEYGKNVHQSLLELIEFEIIRCTNFPEQNEQ